MLALIAGSPGQIEWPIQGILSWRLAYLGTRVYSLPHFLPMDRNIVGGLKAKAHLTIDDSQHRDFEQDVGAVSPAYDHGFLAFPCQNQHD
jgi:hypothetical protein